ncbi:MAG: sensor histidine kinase [Nitrospinaceae bacterium]
MNKLRTLFHPIFVFVGVQIAWIILMGVWINWYLKNSRELQEFAQKIRPDLFTTEFNWVILLEGCFLMLIILAGVYVIFVYWNKQAKLNKLQGNFISSVSHELKSPLASIQLYLETLKYHKVSKEEYDDFVETMLTDTERLSSLIENILESSKYDPRGRHLQFQPVALGEFIADVVKSLKRLFHDRQCEVKLELEGDQVLQLDQRAMRMVFNNLIGNALRYSPLGASLTIRLRNDNKYCEIDFIDQGVGIEKKDIKKIFKKFYRVHGPDTQNIEGAGIGLFIANEIVKNHKGNIRVSSGGRGKGSIFTVSLPLKHNGKLPAVSKRSN